jgi:DNA-directed RNA polymerase alpha subunit/DNA-directed RNA polymerase subunit L
MSGMIKDYASFRVPSEKNARIANDVYKCNFKVSGVHQSLSNGLRRSLLSSVPVVSFDDTYYDDGRKNLNILKNVSALHNEFIAHRISLIPICMYKNKILQVLVDFDYKEQKFVYNFLNDNIPDFSIKIKNDETTREKLKTNTDNSINILSSHIKIEPKEGKTFNPVDEFIIPDYITSDYCLLHRLKPISSNEEVQEAEELQIEMKLTLGTSKLNARYCPVGTVSYEFEKEESSVINKNFDLYMETLQKQRESTPYENENDKLKRFTEEDIAKFKGSYNLLDAERIYKKNEFDEPISVKFCVESVGNLPADQLVYDALSMIELHTIAILNMFKWNDFKKSYHFNTAKINIEKNKQSGFIELTIWHIDHTLGNLIGSYIKRLFIINKIIGEYLNFGTYKMPHPLEDKITIYIGFKDGVSLSGVFAKYGLKSDLTNEIDMAIQVVFLACSSYLSDISKLKSNWTEVSGISNTSYLVNPDNEYLSASIFDKRSMF